MVDFELAVLLSAALAAAVLVATLEQLWQAQRQLLKTLELSWRQGAEEFVILVPAPTDPWPPGVRLAAVWAPAGETAPCPESCGGRRPCASCRGAGWVACGEPK